MRFATIILWQCSRSRSRHSRQTGCSFASAIASPEIEHGLRFVHMGKEDALEAFQVPAARGVAPSLRGAEAAQMTITNARLGQVRRELVLRKTLLARDQRRADVEYECDAGAAQRPDEGDRSAIVANGCKSRQAACGGSRITEMGERQ